MRIDLQGISVDYLKVPVLDDISISFRDKHLTCLIGRSGSGKTTLLRIIAGLEQGFNGKILFDGQDITRTSPGKRNIGWVPQQQLLLPALNVRQNIAFGLESHHLSASEETRRVETIAEQIGLALLLDRKIDRLSGGEKQRVAIARALAPEPSLLLLDEPFSAIDAPERDRLALLLKSLQLDLGITTIHVTHSPREAELLGDDVMVLSNGKIKQHGATLEVFSNPDSLEVASLLSVDNIIPANALGQHPSGIIPISAISIANDGVEAVVITHRLETTVVRVGKEVYLTINRIDSPPGTTFYLQIDLSKLTTLN